MSKIQENGIEWWKAIVASINDGVLVIDNAGIVKIINPEYSRITGVTPDIIGKSLAIYRPGAQLPKTLKDGKSRVGVYRKIKNREYVVDMAPIIIQNKVVGAVSVCKSLTEVHKLSHELQKQNEKVQELEKQMSSIYNVKYTFGDIIGEDANLLELIEVAKKAATSTLPILITGESGTGKELFAQAIHHSSNRLDKPFIPINCSAIPAPLMESELFGYAEGAFTGAIKGGKAGLFEMANQGTLFLDEIGDLSYDVQAKLLRVLEEGRIRRVGEAEERKVDVRIVAATHRDLQQLVIKNHFRGDLFYRLNVVTLQIPALRNRKSDVPFIVNTQLANHQNYEIDKKTMKFLTEYEWPGNVRELKNVIDYAVCMAETELISSNDLPELMRRQSPYFSEEQQGVTLQALVDETEKTHLINTLRGRGTNVKERQKVAEILGISLATLYNKMKKYAIHQ